MLRPYQKEIVDNFYSLEGNTAIVLPTGGGKTVTLSAIIEKWDKPGYMVIIAHRQELVTQISDTLARDGIYHTIVGSKQCIKTACRIHVLHHGECFYRVKHKVIVASVQTLIRRDNIKRIADQVSFWAVDECHHVLRDNTWGKAVEMFPNARGCGLTATPIRTDKKALGADYDGVFHNMIIGEKMINLMEQGFLCSYRLIKPEVKGLDLKNIKISKQTGDYTQKSMSLAVEKAKIYADVVKSYKKFANGTKGVTFVPSVKIAETVKQAYCEAGVPAAVVSAKTPDMLRVKLVDDLRDGRLLQLVNVDLFGEGFDLPAITTVVMARPTNSYSLYSQQLGRALRPVPGKKEAIIIDLVGNIKHGLPELNDHWTLGYYGEKGPRGKSLNKWKACSYCSQVYERFLKTCPHCGYRVVPDDRSDIEMLDGDLTELSPEFLLALRREKLRQFGEPQVPYGQPAYVQQAAVKRWNNRKSHLESIKWFIDEWCGRELNKGLENGEVMRKFYLTFEMDVLSAMTCRDESFINKIQEAICQ